MGGKRVTKAHARKALEKVPYLFSTDELEQVCQQVHLSYDTLIRRLREWGWITEEGAEHVAGQRGRPRKLYEKTAKA